MKTPTTKCPALPATIYALGFPLFGRECPVTPAQAYAAGHPQSAAWSLAWRCDETGRGLEHVAVVGGAS